MRDDGTGSGRLGRWPGAGIALAAFVLALVAAVVVVQTLERDRIAKRRLEVTDIAGSHARLIESHVAQALSATYPLAALVRRGRGSVEGFEAMARELMPYYPGAAALQLAPGGVVRHIVPLAGNERAIGHDLLRDRTRDTEAVRARDTGELTLAGPFELVQGGIAAAGRLPIFLDAPDGRFWGFATVLIRFPQVLETARLDALVAQGLEYRLSRTHPDTGRTQVIAESRARALADPVMHDIRVPNSVWTLEVAPAAGWGDPAVVGRNYALGVLFAALTGIAALLFARTRADQRRLGQLVDERTADLKRQRERLAEVIRGTGAGIWEWNIATGDVRGNERWAEIVGYTLDDLLPMDALRWRTTIHPEDLTAVDQGLRRHFRGESDYYDVEFRQRHRSGAWFWVNARGRVVERGADGRALRMTGTYLEITERKRAQDERERLQAELQQAQRMESIGRLAGGVAHDFNNMLGVIIGHAELGLMRVDEKQPAHANLREIHRAAERSAELTRQLLAYARKQTVAPRVLSLNDAVAGTLQMLRRLIGENVGLVWVPGEDLWPVCIDPSQVDQVLANLCVNARDAIVGAGAITIETRNVTLGEDACEGRSDCRPGDYAMLSVADDGHGMDAVTRAHLFEPFFTTKGVGEGTGLGLATVYGIVTQNGGFVDVESAPGAGTVFRIHLPRSRQSKPEQRVAPGSARGGRETILLVEDEPAVLAMAREMLEGLGYSVIATESPEAAVALPDDRLATIDLLMTDVVMPGMSGRELAAQLAGRNRRLRTLYTSGYPADVIGQRGLIDGSVHFIQKPFTRDALAAGLREVLG